MPRLYATRELTSEGPLRRSSTSPRRTATVNLGESPLGWLHARGHLGDRQFAAGERLRADWETAQLASNITMRWDQVRIKGSGGDHGLTASERQMAAKQRFDAAAKAAGPGLADVVWRVVCAGESLPDAEKALEWPVRSGKLVLKLALDRVADYYRIV